MFGWRCANPGRARPISIEVLGSLRQADVGQAAAFGVVLMLLSAGVCFLAGEHRGTSG